MEFEQQDRPPETPREAAKHFVRTYYKEGERNSKAISKRPLSISSMAYDAQVISAPDGQVVIDHEGEMHHIDQGHLVLTRVGHLPGFALFPLEELLTEIRDEERGYAHGSLAEVFAQEHGQKATQQRRPVIYRSYNGGKCQNPRCGAELGYIEVDGGRDRKYCNNACRVAAHRARRREAEWEQVLQYNSELRQYWRDHAIRGEVLLRLQEILLQHGKAAAKAATDSVLCALQTEREAQSREYGDLVDAVMAGGEAIGFEELRGDEFRIAAGFEGWSQFVGYATHASLKVVRYYLQERRHYEEHKVAARRRLEALSHNGQEQRA